MHGKRTACFLRVVGDHVIASLRCKTDPVTRPKKPLRWLLHGRPGVGKSYTLLKVLGAPDGRSWLYPRGGVPIHSPTRNYGSTIRRRDVAHFTGTGQEAASRGRRETRAPDPYYSAPSLVWS